MAMVMTMVMTMVMAMVLAMVMADTEPSHHHQWRGCAKRAHSQGLFPQERLANVNSRTDSRICMVTTRALALKTLQKSHKKERDLCSQCPFQEVPGNLARHRNSLIWHLTSKGTMGTSIGMVMMIDEGSGATMGIESPILGSLTMNQRLIPLS